MKIHNLTLVLLVAFASAANSYLGNKIPLLESKNRRSGVSYSTSIIHKDSRYPDQHAQSTIDFKLGTGPNPSISEDTHLKPSVYQYTTPKSVQDYKQASFQTTKFPAQKHTFLNYPQQQSQSFNVGYSVKFGNDRKRKPQQIYEPDVITGSHKEEVKNPFAASYDQRPEQNPLVYYSPKPNWKNLSPTVEIYRSKEIDVNKFQPVNYKNFDHERALGKSVGFDYSNAVEINSQQPTHINFPSKKTKLDLSAQGITYSALESKKPKLDFTPFSGLVEAKKPKLDVSVYELKKPKFALDTSLLRDPILTTGNKVLNSISSQQIPIHFDTTLIKEMGKQIKEQHHKQQLNPQQFNNLLQEAGRDSQKYTVFDQNLQHQMYSVNENVEEGQASQPQPTTYKVFAKPQNEFMRHEYEKSNSNNNNNNSSSSNQKKNERLRQARIQPKRVVRHFGMERDLKPPPFANYYIRNRRVHY
ncbi:PREDICTED: uncharacterized protein LOC108556860 [Nicrophorus vespilloides]|uniref:Uncharacterized protein LOC108556860 n=1 Tax=Nicrophorus vespilloides TaxID=110193 RepID=A0ABM1M230_NICVS|nr:PREDICTED: uncharacterized protein LOC108556860 [Nicrophorus vespilloides]